MLATFLGRVQTLTDQLDFHFGDANVDQNVALVTNQALGIALIFVDLVSVSSFCVWFVALATSLGRVQTLTDEFVENFGDANVVQNVFALPGANQELVKSQNNRFFVLLGND